MSYASHPNDSTRQSTFNSFHQDPASTSIHHQVNLYQRSTPRPTPVNLATKPRNTRYFQPAQRHHYPSRSGYQGITTEIIDDIINSILSDEERVKYESKVFLPLHDLIFPSNRPKRTATRSQNSFIIFRKDYQARITAEQGPEIGSRLKEISRSASLFWRSCSPEDKYMYDRIAACTKKLHDRMSPNYICKPMKKYDGHCGSGRMIERYSATFFMPISQDQRKNVSPSSSITICRSRPDEYVANDLTSHCSFRPSVDRLQINSLSSYDKSLIDSVDRNTRI
ncbi:6565_t:CDS:1 [Acaulospora morrowiae]|uniref:6565_t:CDS:1 n=1 Tax=Acaulospora morrowiae TaxID=94023 RepID=A0A9N8ZAD6_9GLOM|nr:6565_t:CDS:1 [Acaulospora morrowiae]